MAKDKYTSTRRAVLGAAVAAPAVIAMGSTIAITAARSATNAEWYALRARYEAAEAEEKAFDRNELEPAVDAFMAARPPEPKIDLGGNDVGLTRAYLKNPGPVREGTLLAAKIEEGRALYAAYDAEVQSINDRFNVDALWERSEQLGEASWALLRQVILTPAPDQPALLWKLEKIANQRDYEGLKDWHEATMADARHLLSSGRA